MWWIRIFHTGVNMENQRFRKNLALSLGTLDSDTPQMNRLIQNKKTTQRVVFYGAVDGARTRDPRRDRPVL
jgi:hypothetical protein